MLSFSTQASIEEDLALLRVSNTTNSQTALQLINKLEKQLPSFLDNEQKSQFYIQKAYYHILKVESEAATNELLKLVALKPIKPSTLASGYSLLSQTKMDQSAYLDAFEYLYLGLEQIPLIENSAKVFSLYHGAANIFIQIGSYDEALENSLKAQRVAILDEGSDDLCYSKAQISDIQLRRNSDVDHLSQLEDALSYCERFEIAVVNANIQNNLGIHYFNQQQYTLAEAAFKEALTKVDINSYKPQTLQTKLGLAKVYLAQKRLTEASKLLHEVIEQSTGSLSVSRRDAYKILAAVSSEQELPRLAFSALKKYSELSELAHKDLSNQNLAYQKVKYANLDQTAQIEILDQKNRLLSLESEVELQSKRNFQLLSLLVLILLSVMVLWLWKIKKQKEKYQRLSEYDGLTGIYNRRHALKLAENAHSSHQKKVYSIIVFDLDYFKAFNDQYGHAFGDWVLREVARVITKEIRRDDIFGRLGGEEFVLILPDSPIEDAQALAQRCAQALQTIKALEHTAEFSVTASFGVANNSNNQPLETLLIQADDAMYKAKKMGRNRIQVHQ